MADSKLYIQGQWVKLIDNGDGTYSIGAELTPSTSIIGKVGIDQATANANEVVVKSITAGENIIGQVGIDQTTDGTTNKVQARNATHGNLQANVTMQLNDVDVAASNPVPVKSDALAPSATFTRPDSADAIQAGDIIGTNPATNLTFSNVLNTAGALFAIHSVLLEIDVAAIPAGMTNFKLHLFNAAPTAIADGTAWALADADRAKYLGYILLDIPVDMGGTLISQTESANFVRKLAAASTTLYGMLETVGAYTATASAVKTITLNVSGV